MIQYSARTQRPDILSRLILRCLTANVVAVIVVAGLGPTLVAAESTPIVRWDFGAEESTPLQSHGGVQRDAPGPRSPEYPDFSPDNTAVKLDGKVMRAGFHRVGEENVAQPAPEVMPELGCRIIIDG